MAEELNMQQMETVDQTKVLIAIHKKTGGDKLAVTGEQFGGYDKRTWAADAVIIRNEETGVDLLVALTGAARAFGTGPEDIPASDSRRKNFSSPQMSTLDGEYRTNYLFGSHEEGISDDCALCYCRDLGMFLPSGGEMQQVADHLEDVNALLETAGGTPVSGLHWTSTMQSVDYPWHMDVDGNSFGFWLSKTNALNVRPMGDASAYQEVSE